MKHLTSAMVVVILGCLSLAGCASPSQITLLDGRQIPTKDTPRFDEQSGFYEYEELNGSKAQVNKDKVRSIKAY